MRFKSCILFCISFFALNNTFSFAQKNQVLASSELYAKISHLKNAGSVLYIAAHPDDENTRLLAYLANVKGINAYYLSLTRGDGGQNLIGTEQGDLLGMIRTQELLEARKKDHAHQFFTRAVDFGYSKTPEETFSIWNKDSVLSDMVWVIRKTKPSVIICRFPTNGDGGHGHHTASALLAEEAFDAAADPSKFSWQLKYVETWKAKRLLWNAFVRNKNTDVSSFYKLDIGSYIPETGKSIGEIASLSRSCHKSQGFGAAAIRGEQPEYFKHIKGDSAKNNDIFDGLSFSMKDIKGSESYVSQLENVLSTFNLSNPGKSTNGLIATYKATDKILDAYWKALKKKELQQIIAWSSGLWLEANSTNPYLVSGEKYTLQLYAINRSENDISIQAISVKGKDSSCTIPCTNNKLFQTGFYYTVPANEPISIAYWLKENSSQGLSTINSLSDLGNPENKFPIEINYTVKINGSEFIYTVPLTYKWTDPVEGELYRKALITPELTANIRYDALVVNANDAKSIPVLIEAFANVKNRTITLNAPNGWTVTPQSIVIDSLNKGNKRECVFTIKPNANAQNGRLIPGILTNEKLTKLYSIKEITYPHIPYQVHFSKEHTLIYKGNYTVSAKKIGYISGAGDKVAECISLMGCHTEILTPEKIQNEALQEYDAIVIGIRAYNTHEYLVDVYPRLMNYVKEGGTLIIQYNTNNFLGILEANLGPYPFKISRNRVTNEKSPIAFADSLHPLLNYPNKITLNDFNGWVQERGLYFPSDQDKKYECILKMNDPSEKELNTSILYTRYGKGVYIYTGLAFFRQLPSGVPGADKKVMALACVAITDNPT